MEQLKNITAMDKPSLKRNEIAEMQSVCRDILVEKLLDHVRLYGKKATWKSCYEGRLTDGDGDAILKVLDLGGVSFSLEAGRFETERHRVMCLYVAEDEFGRQYLMYWGDDGRLDYPKEERESLLNRSLAFVNAIADIVKKL